MACSLYRVEGSTIPPVPSPAARSTPASSPGELHAGPEGTPRRGPHGSPSCFGAAPGAPHPSASTALKQVRGEEDALPPPRGKKRATMPKVPHPWMELNDPLFPSKSRTASLSLLPSEGLEQWGSVGCSGAVPAPRPCPAAPGTERLVRGKSSGTGHGRPRSRGLIALLGEGASGHYLPPFHSAGGRGAEQRC